MDEAYIRLNGKRSTFIELSIKKVIRLIFFLEPGEMRQLQKPFSEKHLEKMEDLTKSLLIRAAAIKQPLIILTKLSPKKSRLRFDRSNTLTTSLSKIIDLSRREQSQPLDLRTFIQQERPFQELKTFE